MAETKMSEGRSNLAEVLNSLISSESLDELENNYYNGIQSDRSSYKLLKITYEERKAVLEEKGSSTPYYVRLAKALEDYGVLENA